MVIFLVYKKARKCNRALTKLIKKYEVNSFRKDQLKRAVVSSILNIAEGNSRFSLKGCRNFSVVVRGSIREAITVVGLLEDDKIIDIEYSYEVHKLRLEVFKMLNILVGNLIKKENEK